MDSCDKQNKHISHWAGSLARVSGAPSAANMAETFTPTLPMCLPGANPKTIKVKGDVPDRLRQAMAKGLQRIGLQCLRENAEMLMSLYEDICLQHVIKQQIKDKVLRKLMAITDPAKEQENARTSKVADSSCVAKSSLLGMDPWGDEPAPEPRGSDEEEDDNTVGGYTREQLLLMAIQDQNYLYLTAHVWLILEDEIATNV